MLKFTQKIKIIVSFCFLIISLVHGKTLQNQIQVDIKSGQLSPIDGLYLEAITAYAPEKLPEPYQNLEQEIIKSGFGLMASVRLNWQKFSVEQQALLKAYSYRPSADTSIISESGRFRIHYYRSGNNAVDLTDSDLNNIPDYIDVVARVADSVYVIEVEGLSLKAPLDDDNIDGPEWDIYIQNLPNVYGQTTPEKQVTSNPDQYYGYMELDNNYQHTYTKGLNGMRVTMAHEFFHLIHMAYNLRSSNYFTIDDLFLMEASSTWMEDYVYDDVNDYYAYLNSFFKSNNVAFDRTGSNHEYGLSIWFHYLQKKFGTPNIVRETWEAVVDMPGLESLDYVLKARGFSFNSAMTEFYGWNVMTGDRSNPSRFYEEGAYYPQIKFDDADSIQTDVMIETAIVPLAVRYFSYTDSDDSQVILAPVNVSRDDQGSENTCQVFLHKGDAKPGYTSLGNGFYGALVSEDDWQWQFASAIEINEDPWILNTFVESKDGFGSVISGMVFHDLDADGNFDLEDPRLGDIVIQLSEIGDDSLYNTEDDIVFPIQMSLEDGTFEFTGLAKGNYCLDYDKTLLPAGMLFSTLNTPIYIPVDENETIEDIRFGFRTFEEIELPAAIPQPYIINDIPHLKIPFPCEEDYNYTLYIYSSSGYCLYSEKMYFDAADVQFFEWEGIDNNSQKVPSGIYFYIIESDGSCIRKEKIAVIR